MGFDLQNVQTNLLIVGVMTGVVVVEGERDGRKNKFDHGEH